MATRTPDEIRAEIEVNRRELSTSLEKLRREVVVLTGWIFDRAPVSEEELERAKDMIVLTICRGLER